MRFRTASSSIPRGLASATAAGLLLATLLAGCGDDEGEEATDSTTTTGEPATSSTTEPTASTTEPAETTSTTGGGGVSDKPEPSGEVDESTTPEWQRTAVPYRDQVGQTIEFECPAGGEPYSVWGTNVYTDDSSVCTAAVHVGLITFDEGGTVGAEILGEGDAFIGSESNDVLTFEYGAWGGSFSFPDADLLDVEASIPWNRQANFYSDRGGEDITANCPADGTPAGVWGTDVYTSDSSVCTAAVHSGLITLEDGGEVTFRLIDGQEEYTGSEANGIESFDYGPWNGSFEFVGAA
jgi:hypothetical protein